MENQVIINPWSIIEEGFDPERICSAESLFSIGNGAVGQRANFEESYSGHSLQGSYLGGIYYPDKTRVGWWKNGYPEYFAKVLNAPNWIGIDIKINGQVLDLATVPVTRFRRELNMKEGWYERKFQVQCAGVELAVTALRFISYDNKELACIKYKIQLISGSGSLSISPYLDGGIVNADANWDERFWNTLSHTSNKNQAYLLSETKKTEFVVQVGMKNFITKNGEEVPVEWEKEESENKIGLSSTHQTKQGDEWVVYKFASNATSLNHDKEDLRQLHHTGLDALQIEDFAKLKEEQAQSWSNIWRTSDIQISGDDKAQQGIRFNIFQLNQTYSGEDARLNIGPKGFTGEKYGGSTYWDTEAYCLPFYMCTKGEEVARNLLLYRYNQLDKAIENAEKLGFSDGAALYPMVTMDGTECHNEWEITFEEIHRNGAIAFAIYNYQRFTGDTSYIKEYGIDVLIGIARFWVQRVNFSQEKQAYVMLGVTGPNEYENNVNNNWYTNYIAKWCIQFTNACLEKYKQEEPSLYSQILARNSFKDEERITWETVSSNFYFPKDEKLGIFLQQDGFLDKDLVPASEIPQGQRPINQYWSWDRILRSPYIKQGDVLQGFYFFEDHFSKEELEKHYKFYEPLTVHESSLSPCIHAVLATHLGMMDHAYELYLRTSRLDLDDYNKEIEEGCHITSMAGTWLSIVEGFGGMKMQNGHLHFYPSLPKQWESLHFKIQHRSRVLAVHINQHSTTIKLEEGSPLKVFVNNEERVVSQQTVLS